VDVVGWKPERLVVVMVVRACMFRVPAVFKIHSSVKIFRPEGCGEQRFSGVLAILKLAAWNSPVYGSKRSCVSSVSRWDCS
jgi:hypothetical protein